MYSVHNICVIADGFPHSEISGSKVVCHLPEAYRRLLRPSSPPTAKASTVCAYSLDHILEYTRWNKKCSRILSPDITLESSNSERWLITSQWVAIVQISNVIRALWKELSECRLIYPKAIRTQSHLRMSIQIWIHHKFTFDADLLKSWKTILK